MTFSTSPHRPTPAAINCTGIQVSFGSTTVLHDVNLTASLGRVHALLGRNGAGKSTLFSVILGLLEPDAGEVRVLGRPRDANSLRHIGASVNGPAFYGHLSARKNLLVHTALLGLPDSEADRTLDLVGLTSAGTKKAKSFSTGMKARLALAQAMLGQPDILLLDEPQNGLDPQGIADLRHFLRGWAHDGGCVIISSHQLGEIAQLADDVTVIADGHVRYNGELASLAPAGQLEEEFFRLTMGDR